MVRRYRKTCLAPPDGGMGRGGSTSVPAEWLHCVSTIERPTTKRRPSDWTRFTRYRDAIQCTLDLCILCNREYVGRAAGVDRLSCATIDSADIALVL